MTFGCGLANKHLNREQHYPRDKNRKSSHYIRGKVIFKRGYFLSCSHLAIPAKLHGPKGDRINESLLYKR